MTTPVVPPTTEPEVSRGEQVPTQPPDEGECFNGITEFGFLPCEEEVVRGEQVPQTPPDPGRCIDGITEWGFLPCEVEVADSLPPVPTAAIVEVQTSTPAVEQTLPVTGSNMNMGLTAIVLLTVGVVLNRFGFGSAR